MMEFTIIVFIFIIGVYIGGVYLPYASDKRMRSYYLKEASQREYIEHLLEENNQGELWEAGMELNRISAVIRTLGGTPNHHNHELIDLINITLNPN